MNAQKYPSIEGQREACVNLFTSIGPPGEAVGVRACGSGVGRAGTEHETPSKAKGGGRG